MVEKSVTVTNPVGLHSTPATLFTNRATKFQSDIFVIKGQREMRAKSLLGVLSLAVISGDVITIKAEGSDEAEAVDALVKLVEADFAE